MARKGMKVKCKFCEKEHTLIADSSPMTHNDDYLYVKCPERGVSVAAIDGELVVGYERA